MASKKKAPAFLIFDEETVPDGVLLARTKYAGKDFSPEQAVEQARKEALEKSQEKSDFVALTYCYPVAISVARVHGDYSLEAITCLDDPEFRPQEIVADFWKGLSRYDSTLVSFNGRGFDLPVLEMRHFAGGFRARSILPRSLVGVTGTARSIWIGGLDQQPRGAPDDGGTRTCYPSCWRKPGKMETKARMFGLSIKRGRSRDQRLLHVRRCGILTLSFCGRGS